MNINELTIGEAKELANMFGRSEVCTKRNSLKIGEKYLIRTVTHYHLGRVKDITMMDVVLSDASWIPNTGRFHDCLTKSTLEEIEPFKNDAIVMIGAIVDITKWDGDLPKQQK